MAPAQQLLAYVSINRSNVYFGGPSFKVTKQRDKIFQIDYETANK